MLNASQTRIKMDGFPTDFLRVTQFELVQYGYNQPFKGVIHGESEMPIPMPKNNQSLKVNIDIEEEQVEYIGEAHNMELWQVNANTYTFKLDIVSSLFQLDSNKKTRLYVDKTVIEIISDILNDYQIQPKFHLNQNYDEIPYTAQGEVSDYDFIQRLCVEHGLMFYQQFLAEKDEIIFFDSKLKSQLHELQFLPKKGFNHQNKVITKISIDELAIPEGTQLLTKQLSCQKNKIIITALSTNILPGDRVKISNYQDKLYRVICVGGRIDETAIDGLTQPWTQEVIMIPDSDDYYYPGIETCSILNTATTYTLPEPGLELGDVDGVSDKVCLDEYGQYTVHPLFDKSLKAIGKASHRIAMLQPGGGPGKIDSQGLHFPLRAGSRVVLGHLAGQIDKPIILGALPTEEQLSPVADDNPFDMTLRHQNGLVLNFQEKSPMLQELAFYTENKKHGIWFIKDNQDENIKINSSGYNQYQAEIDIHIVAKDFLAKSTEATLKANKNISSVSNEQLTMISGEHVRVKAENDISITSEKGTILSKVTEDMTVESSKNNITAASVQMTTNNFTSDSINSHLQGGQGVSLNSGGSNLTLCSDSIGFKSQQINIDVARIQKHQGGSVNTTSGQYKTIDAVRPKSIIKRLSRVHHVHQQKSS